MTPVRIVPLVVPLKDKKGVRVTPPRQATRVAIDHRTVAAIRASREKATSNA